MNEWWNATSGTYLGAIGGSGLGIIGGLLGPMIGILAPRGRCKVLVMSLVWTVVCACAALLVAGIVAAAEGQPRHVWYPLLLIGGIGCCALGPLSFVVRFAYRQAELRKLEAESLRRS
jgi:MFS family permease